MYGLNPNQQYAPFTNFTPHTPGFATNTPYGVYTPFTQGALQGAASSEMQIVLSRIEEVRCQVLALNEMIRIDFLRRNAGALNSFNALNTPNTLNAMNGMNPYAGLNSFGGLNSFNGLNNFNGAIDTNCPIRLRESDSHIFMDVYLPGLTMGDVDVEVSGNRIVCRTRVPVAPISRIWANAQIPRGFELYELADGRVEFSWIAPVSFQAKEVEATWREGFLCVCIPKTEVTPRHTVKVVRETVSNRKASSDMNS